MIKWLYGKPYAYKSRRVNGVTKCEYLGSGELAIAAEKLNQIQARKRRQEIAQRIEARRLAAAKEREADKVLRDALDAMAGVLTRSGFWRGSNLTYWRPDPMAKGRAGQALAVMTEAEAGSIEAFRAWARGQLQAAHDGDARAAEKLRKAFRSNPSALVELGGWTLPNVVKAHKAGRAFSPDDHAARLGLEAQVEELASDLAGPNASPLVVTLAELVALLWLDVHLAELSDETSNSHERRRSKAQSRLLRAMGQLAQVKRLAIPTVQAVNVGGVQQVNVGSDTGSLPRRGPFAPRGSDERATVTSDPQPVRALRGKKRPALDCSENEQNGA